MVSFTSCADFIVKLTVRTYDTHLVMYLLYGYGFVVFERIFQHAITVGIVAMNKRENLDKWLHIVEMHISLLVHASKVHNEHW